MNEITFDVAVLNELKGYIYALRDPRDRKIFYIGKAGGHQAAGNERVLSHFDEARAATDGRTANPTAKVRRILEIWAEGLEVDWFVIRHGLAEEEIGTLLHIEAALIDLLEVSQNGPTLNIVKGHRSGSNGLLSSDEVVALTAPPVAPTSYLNRPVFIFPVQRAIEQGRSPFEATRMAWSVSPAWRSRSDALAVGVVRGVSVGAYAVDSWLPHDRLWAFQGTDLGVCELHVRNYLPVIARAQGYWMRGNYLIVEFLQDAKFRFYRGSAEKGERDLT